jgi:hypothetical protein
MGIVGLARALGGIKCDAEIGLDHLYNPAGEAEWPDPCDRPKLGPPRPA